MESSFDYEHGSREDIALIQEQNIDKINKRQKEFIDELNKSKNRRQFLRTHRLNLKNATLRELTLKGIDLSYAYMENAILDTSNLSNAKLVDTYLLKADLKNTIMNNANLTGAILCSADLSGAKLKNTSLCYARLQECKLHKADLSYANLSRTYLSLSEFNNAKLVHTNFIDAELSGSNITGADLFGVGFFNCCTNGLQCNYFFIRNLRVPEEGNLLQDEFVNTIDAGDIYASFFNRNISHVNKDFLDYIKSSTGNLQSNYNQRISCLETNQIIPEFLCELINKYDKDGELLSAIKGYFSCLISNNIDNFIQNYDEKLRLEEKRLKTRKKPKKKSGRPKDKKLQKRNDLLLKEWKAGKFGTYQEAANAYNMKQDAVRKIIKPTKKKLIVEKNFKHKEWGDDPE